MEPTKDRIARSAVSPDDETANNHEAPQAQGPRVPSAVVTIWQSLHPEFRRGLLYALSGLLLFLGGCASGCTYVAARNGFGSSEGKPADTGPSPPGSVPRPR